MKTRGFAALVILTMAGCSRSNNLLMGRVQAKVGSHRVVVTDCYRTSVPAPERLADASEEVYRFKPCRDADVLIRGEELLVNGRSYGHLSAADAVLIDHSVVSVQRNK